MVVVVVLLLLGVVEGYGAWCACWRMGYEREGDRLCSQRVSHCNHRIIQVGNGALKLDSRQVLEEVVVIHRDQRKVNQPAVAQHSPSKVSRPPMSREPEAGVVADHMRVCHDHIASNVKPRASRYRWRIYLPRLCQVERHVVVSEVNDCTEWQCAPLAASLHGPRPTAQ